MCMYIYLLILHLFPCPFNVYQDFGMVCQSAYACGNLIYVHTIFADMSIHIVCNVTEYLTALKNLLEHYRAYI